MDQPKRSSLAPTAALAVGAIVIVGAVILFAGRRDGNQDAAAGPSASVTAAAVATSSLTHTFTPASLSPTAAAAGARPDAAHGVITFENLRTEDDPRGLQQPPQFSRAPNAVPFTAGIGVSPDGKTVAMIRTGQTTQQLITFTTARPNDVTIVVDFSGSGESPGGLVWAGDGSASLLLAVHRVAPPQPSAYSTLRVVDLATKQVRETVRITSGSFFMPIAWRPDRGVAAAVEIAAGAASTYDLVRGGGPSIERTPLGGSGGPIIASRDGLRVAAVITFAPEVPAALSWWPMDQPAAAKTISAPPGTSVDTASFRPGTPDEVGVNVGPPCCPAGQGVPPPGHFEIWNVATGQQRVVNATIGFALWRVDGTAALMGNTLIDPTTGATTPIPGTFKLVDVVLF